MGTLVLVRHGQASLHAEDYDQLSTIGGMQSEALGHYWVTMQHKWDRAFVGPRRRHQQTADLVSKTYKNRGFTFPNYEHHEAFDEHQGAWVVKAELDQSSGVGATNFIPKDGLKDPETVLAFMTKFRDIMHSWVGGTLDYPQFETWRAFRERIVHGLTDILLRTEAGQKVVVFSSAGPLAVATGHCLGLGDEAILDLKWQILNSAIAEFKVRKGKLSLVSFNSLPHVQNPDLRTLV